MKHLTSEELHNAMSAALIEVRRRLASGELDGSGRFYTDEELAHGAATGRFTPEPHSNSEPKSEEPAA